jgi:hypothetical protein
MKDVEGGVKLRSSQVRLGETCARGQRLGSEEMEPQREQRGRPMVEHALCSLCGRIFFSSEEEAEALRGA